jgi:hypothetical protein
MLRLQELPVSPVVHATRFHQRSRCLYVEVQLGLLLLLWRSMLLRSLSRFCVNFCLHQRSCSDGNAQMHRERYELLLVEWVCWQ